MTNMLTDDDLTVIEKLDFTPGCVFTGCVREVVCLASYHGSECFCGQEHFFCDRHKSVLICRADEPVPVRCTTCGTSPQNIVIDRIEPLR